MFGVVCGVLCVCVCDNSIGKVRKITKIEELEKERGCVSDESEH